MKQKTYMRKILFTLLVIPSFLFAQKKEISLSEIWKGEFREQHLEAYRPMNNNCYSLLDYNYQNKTTSIDVYSYATLEKTKTLVSSSELENVAYFDDYAFNKDETQVLLSTNSQQIYRRSSKAIFYLYDIKLKKAVLIDAEPIQEPTFSNDSKKVAFVKDNNIYIKDIVENKTEQITFDGKYNHTINGIADWVYEEELSMVKAFIWSKDSQRIAFLKFDESEVPFYSMDIVGKELYPSQQTFKYPKAGEKNAVVSLHTYDIETKSTQKVNLGNYEYIADIRWTEKKDEFAVITLNRHQNHLKLHIVNTQNYKSSLLLEEQNNTYIDIVNTNNLTFLKDNSFIWTSEKSGFNHLYHYSNTGKLKKQITSGDWEVTKFYGIHKKSNELYYQSVETGSTNKSIYRISLKGTHKKLISAKTGTSDADFSKDKSYCILNHSDVSTPTTYTLFNKGKKIKEILNNNSLLDKLKEYQYSNKEFFELKTKDATLNSWILKPANFNPNKQYPLLMVQYSGPGSQKVENSWNSYNDYWYQHLAQKGYIVACIDGRGTGFKGSAFKRVTYKELGKYETIDQIEAAKVLGKRSYIDADRIGIWGWSFGGFMASNCLLKGNDVFNTAIAVAPVTSWRYYDSIYTERYMQTPQENPSGYDENSPLFHAKKLKGNYLIIHGTGDDNVHVQNTYQMVNALIEENKPFEQAIYPDRTHGIYRGKNTRLHLFAKMTDFLDKNLKK